MIYLSTEKSAGKFLLICQRSPAIIDEGLYCFLGIGVQSGFTVDDRVIPDVANKGRERH
jgi:hypothetical protein